MLHRLLRQRPIRMFFVAVIVKNVHQNTAFVSYVSKNRRNIKFCFQVVLSHVAVMRGVSSQCYVAAAGLLRQYIASPLWRQLLIGHCGSACIRNQSFVAVASSLWPSSPTVCLGFCRNTSPAECETDTMSSAVRTASCPALSYLLSVGLACTTCAIPFDWAREKKCSRSLHRASTVRGGCRGLFECGTYGGNAEGCTVAKKRDERSLGDIARVDKGDHVPRVLQRCWP